MKLISKKDERLYNDSEDILKEDIADNTELFDSMTKLMQANRGIGIAAPQVGVNKNVFILMDHQMNPKICINPKITAYSEKAELMEEGCITFPGIFMKVKRNFWTDVSYLNENGEKIEERLAGLESQCFQHELDHLNGVTFDQRVSQFVYRRALEKRNKKVKRIMRRMK